MKLHLGCGQRRFDGYINVDYPLSEHSVQRTSVADEFHDLTALRYPAGAVDEVRLHHVFEHFERAKAAALLASWNSWLKPGGSLHVEVPDFGRTARAVLARFSNAQARMVGLRHIFGSQEAHWAVHYEGYTRATLCTFLERFGLDPVNVKQERWKDTYNLTVIARKARELSAAEREAAGRDHLRQYLVDDSASERDLLEIWMDSYRHQLTRTLATG